METLALVMALDAWGPRVAGLTVKLSVYSDSVTALAITQRQSGASPALNFLGAVMGLLLESFRMEEVCLQHLPGTVNKAADWLSRPSTWPTSQKPAEISHLEPKSAKVRTDSFYPLPTPGRAPPRRLEMVQARGSPGCEKLGGGGATSFHQTHNMSPLSFVH